ncbi:hypothetical protein Tco_0487296 [Tanacetum coccineum]
MANTRSKKDEGNKGEFNKIKDIKVKDDSLACDSPLEVFFNYESKSDDDSEQEADDMGFIQAMDEVRASLMKNFILIKEDEIVEVDPDLLTKDIMGFKTYDDYKDDWIYEWNKDVPWVDEKPWTDTRV